jgi:hypothetical protein
MVDGLSTGRVTKTTSNGYDDVAAAANCCSSLAGLSRVLAQCDSLRARRILAPFADAKAAVEKLETVLLTNHVR